MRKVKFELSLNNNDLRKYETKIENECPFCENDYIKVERNINLIDGDFLVSAHCFCGACGAQGPIYAKTTKKQDIALEQEVVVEAVKKWNKRRTK